MAYSSCRRGGFPLTTILPRAGLAQSSRAKPSGTKGAGSTAKFAMSTGRSLSLSGVSGEAEGGGREGETSSWAAAMEAEVGFSVAPELFGGGTLLPPALWDSG
jgi:hypothetical protein